MHHQALIEALRREGEALGAVKLVDVDVPTCPEWTLPELIHHVGSVHRWQTAQVLATDPNQLVKVEPPPRPALSALADWYQTGFVELLNALAQVEADQPTPSWFGPRSATFWARRAAHETAIHRWDAQAAITTPDPLHPDQAVDIIDELFEVVVPHKFKADRWEGPAVTIHLHATDIEAADGEPAGEWLISLGPDGFTVTKTHAKGDVAVRGPVSDLALMVVGRLPPARLEVHGEAAVLDRWFAAVRY